MIAKSLVPELTELATPPIVDLDAATKFIEALEAKSALWHFDDDPADCLGLDDAAVEESHLAGLLSDRVGEMFDLDWGQAGCPHGYVLHLTAKADPEHHDASCLLPDDWRPVVHPEWAVTVTIWLRAEDEQAARNRVEALVSEQTLVPTEGLAFVGAAAKEAE